MTFDDGDESAGYVIRFSGLIRWMLGVVVLSEPADTWRDKLSVHWHITEAVFSGWHLSLLKPLELDCLAASRR